MASIPQQYPEAPLSPAQRIKSDRARGAVAETDLADALEQLNADPTPLVVTQHQEPLSPLSPAQRIKANGAVEAPELAAALDQAEEDDEDDRQAQLDQFSSMVKEHMADKVNNGTAGVHESTDKRVRRIESAKTYSRGVDEYRARTAVEPPRVTEGPDQPLSRVFVRARPLFEHESARGEWHCVSGCASGLTVHEGCEQVKPRKGRIKMLRHHGFQQVQRIDTDEGVAAQLGYLTAMASSGEMATLFMYGMTGSGKTYSTNIMFEAAPHDLLAAAGTVNLIAYELVGKRCFDLLGADKQQVHLRIGADGATHVQDTTVREAQSAQELHAFLKEASDRRETASTGTNATSSRSHAVYQLSNPNGGTLTIIDLAGNEGNIETAYHTKEQMREAAEINSSLMALRTCLAARASGKAHVPYRESMLTRVLRDALTRPDAATAVLCCVSPACSHMERTLVTLRSAVNLTGQKSPSKPVEEEIKDKGIVKGGPSDWDADALATWLSEQEFGCQVVLPAGMNGQKLMKLTAVRLASLCGGDTATGKKLFAALRIAAKESAAKDIELRRAMKGGPKPTSSMSFSRAAPSQPMVSRQ